MESVRSKFQKIGARVRAFTPSEHFDSIKVDIHRDAEGEYFELSHGLTVDVRVLDARPHDRHLLLAAFLPDRGHTPASVSTFLCGHDERAWFVAAIPEDAKATTVQAAKDALKPQEVWEAMQEHSTPMHQRDQRCTDAFVRQGEWFFLPRPWLDVDENDVLHDEEIRRGLGKPHLCECLYREGGETVYFTSSYPNGLTEAEFRAVQRKHRQFSFRQMQRNARVYVKGAVRHPDHATIRLGYWHQVVPNAESRAVAMRHVAFLD